VHADDVVRVPWYCRSNRPKARSGLEVGEAYLDLHDNDGILRAADSLFALLYSALRAEQGCIVLLIST
jgi:hypothetical protein